MPSSKQPTMRENGHQTRLPDRQDQVGRSPVMATITEGSPAMEAAVAIAGGSAAGRAWIGGGGGGRVCAALVWAMRMSICNMSA